LFENIVVNRLDLVKDLRLYNPNPYFKKQVPDFSKKNFEDGLFPANYNSLLFIDQTKKKESFRDFISEQSSKNSLIVIDPALKKEHKENKENNHNHVNLKEEEYKAFNELIWCRPQDIFTDSEFNFFDKNNVKDIKRGVFQKGHFVSCLLAIAKIPIRIERLFINRKIQENGCYAFNLFIQGKLKSVTVDDKIPVLANKKWAFAHSDSNDIWVPLFEKVWAKVNRSYSISINSSPKDIFSAITEAPVITYNHKKYEGCEWDIFTKNCENPDYIIFNSTSSLDSCLPTTNLYTIITYYDIDDLKLLKVKSLDSIVDWNGAYGNKSSNWTNNLKEQVNFEENNEQVFYLTLKEYLKCFNSTHICKYYDAFYYKFRKVYQLSQDNIIGCRFKISKKTKVVLGLHQKQEHFYYKVKNYEPCHAKLILVKFTNHSGYHTYEYINSTEEVSDRLYLDHLSTGLEPGEYFILGNVKWPYLDEDKNISLVLSSYSDNYELDFHHLERKTISRDMFNKVFISFIDKNLTYNMLTEDIKGFSYVNALIKGSNTGYFFLSFKNDSFAPCKVTFVIEMNEYVKLFSENIECEPLENNYLQYSVILAPMNTEIILFEQLADIWKCLISLKSIEIDDSINMLSLEDDRFYINEHKNGLIRERFIKNDVFYSELRRNNSLILVLENESSKDYFIKVEFISLFNCQVKNAAKSMFRLNNNSMNYITLIQLDPGAIDFELEYAYKIL